MRFASICGLWVAALISVRIACAEAPNIGDVPASLPPELREAVRKAFLPEGKDRKAALSALSKIGAGVKPAVPFLVRLLANDTEFSGTDTHGTWARLYVSGCATQALEATGVYAIPNCVAALKRASGIEKQSLIDILTSTRDPKAMDAIIPLINDPDETTSYGAVVSLYVNRCSDRRLVAPLAHALVAGKSDNIRRSSADALGNVRDPAAVDALLPAINETSSPIRNAAIRSLGKQKDRRAVPALIAAMKRAGEDDEGLREQAAWALGEIGDERALAPLVTMLKERTQKEYDRCAAAAALGALGRPGGLPALKAALENREDNYEVRSEAVLSIAKLEGAKAAPLLAGVAKTAHDSGKVRFWASLEAISLMRGEVDDVALLPPLQGYFDENESEYDRPARQALKQTVLQSLVEHGKNEEVRSAAAKMLDELKKQPQ